MNDWKTIPEAENHLSVLWGKPVRISLILIANYMIYAAWDGEQFHRLLSRRNGQEVIPFGWRW